MQTEKSVMTDQTSVYMATESLEPVACRWGSAQKISLTLRCHENATAVFISTHCHLTSSEYNSYGDVDVRIDDQKARTIGMDVSTDNRALGLWRGGRSIPFIRTMLGRKRMVVRITPYGESPFTATFPIDGVDTAIEPLKKACGW